eukprot:SAG11_NODE_1675_length_4475_cov_20.017824_5_plen_93_part_00
MSCAVSVRDSVCVCSPVSIGMRGTHVFALRGMPSFYNTPYSMYFNSEGKAGRGGGGGKSRADFEGCARTLQFLSTRVFSSEAGEWAANSDCG